MRYLERKEFLYDPEVFKQIDVNTALTIYAEWTQKSSPNPYPTFMEVDRDADKVDDLWHTPVDGRVKFKREIAMPCINKHEKPDWRMTKLGIQPLRQDDFWLSNLILKELDYFPNRGDIVYFNGYRYMINLVVIDPTAMWQQTNIWLGIVCKCVVPPDGDAKPLLDVSTRAPSEVSTGVGAQGYQQILPEPVFRSSHVSEFPVKLPNK